MSFELKQNGKIKSHILAPARLKVFNTDGTTTTYIRHVQSPARGPNAACV